MLVATAEVLKRHVREQDVIARWGGEEFLLLLPETGVEAAAALAERLRRMIADIRVAGGGEESAVTASFGVVQRRPEHASLDALVSLADDLLYQAKNTGRNQVRAMELAAAG